MPCLNLQRLPVIDITKSNELVWLHPHTALQLSTQEHDQRDKSIVSGSADGIDVRTKFKETLSSMFVLFSGIQSETVRIFALNNPTGGGMHILIFVSRLLLDLANHTIVLDSTIIPITNGLVTEIAQFLGALCSPTWLATLLLMMKS